MVIKFKQLSRSVMQLSEICRNKKKFPTNNASSDNLQQRNNQFKLKSSKNAPVLYKNFVHQSSTQNITANRQRQTNQFNTNKLSDKKIELITKKAPQFLQNQSRKSPQKQKTQLNKKQLGKTMLTLENSAKQKHSDNQQKKSALLSLLKLDKNEISSLLPSTNGKPSFLKKVSVPESIASEKILRYKQSSFTGVKTKQLLNRVRTRKNELNQDCQKHYGNIQKKYLQRNNRVKGSELFFLQRNKNITWDYQPTSNEERKLCNYPQFKKANSSNTQNRSYGLLIPVVQQNQIVCPQQEKPQGSRLQQVVFKQKNRILSKLKNNQFKSTTSLILEDLDQNNLFETLKKIKSPINMSSVYEGTDKTERETLTLDHLSQRQQVASPVSARKVQKVLIIADFIKIKDLGRGRYGEVFLAKEKVSGFIYAVKKLNKRIIIQQGTQDQVIRELKLQSFLNHPNIIKMYGFFADQQHIYIILEPALQGQFYQFLQRKKVLSQAKSANFLRQICSALGQLHDKKILHRDIKPQNIVMHQNILKLCDFGWSVYHGNQMRTTFCGTPLYVCPEILKGYLYDQKVDIWSLGVMAYEMMIGDNPFNIKTENQLAKILNQQFSIPKKSIVSQECEQMLQKLLKKNPQQRPNIWQLQRSSFFKRYPDKNSQKQKMFGFI